MAKHLGSTNAVSCQLLMVAVSHHDTVGVVMGLLFCNPLKYVGDTGRWQGMRGAEQGVIFVLYKLAMCGNRGECTLVDIVCFEPTENKKFHWALAA